MFLCVVRPTPGRSNELADFYLLCIARTQSVFAAVPQAGVVAHLNVEKEKKKKMIELKHLPCDSSISFDTHLTNS